MDPLHWIIAYAICGFITFICTWKAARRGQSGGPLTALFCAAAWPAVAGLVVTMKLDEWLGLES